MVIWQADFYRRPLQTEDNQPLWELFICDVEGHIIHQAQCPQSQASSAWLESELKTAIATHAVPEVIQVFRPQSVSLLKTACAPLGIEVDATRRTAALKRLLVQQVANYQPQTKTNGYVYLPLALDRPPPNPLPENLWGDQWRFAAIAAQDLEQSFAHEPIPFLHLPADLKPIQLGLPSTSLIPGVIVYGGRQSWRLAEWIQRAKPVELHYIPGEPDGLILEAGLVERWILATFDDADVKAAARTFAQRQQTTQGLHFLLIQPDDSGMTYTGLWLLQQQNDAEISQDI